MISRLPLPYNKRQTIAILERLKDSAVVWSWFYNASRLASGLILLPLVLKKLPVADLGMYYVLLSLTALVPLVDFGFGPTIGRFVSFAVGGAESIQSQGVPKFASSTAPNYDLLWQLLFTTRALYRFTTLVLLLVLGVWGTYVVELRITETSYPALTRVAWAVTLVSALFDIYSNWWIIYLRSMNFVRKAAQIDTVAMLVRLVLAAVLLVCGAGLLSLPLAGLVGSFLQRYLARRHCLESLAGHPPPKDVNVKNNLRILWPNTWRLGILFLSGYLTVNANIAICLYAFGLAANAQYGLSVQIVTVVSGMSAVWTGVKWPAIGQHRARHDLLAIQRILKPRIWLQTITFLTGAGLILLCGPLLLHTFGSGKTLLPHPWLGLLIANSFFEMFHVFCGTLISTENRLPQLWFVVAGNVLSLTLSLTLIHVASLGLGALVLGPLIAGSLFNYWYWPHFTARSLGTSLGHLLFSRQPPQKSGEQGGPSRPNGLP